MLYEIRSYHFAPEQFDDYCFWARKEAVPFLKANMDLIGFWVNSREPSEIWGSDIESRKHSPANVTWIVRWKSMEHRNQGHKEVFGSEEWQDM